MTKTPEVKLKLKIEQFVSERGQTIDEYVQELKSYCQEKEQIVDFFLLKIQV